MYSNGLKTIAVFAAEMQSQSSIQRSIVKSLSEQAYRLGYNVAVFNWNNPFSKHTGYIDGQIEIFDLPDYSKIDAVIYIKLSIDMPEVEDMLEERILSNVKGPCVTINSYVEGFYNLFSDDEIGITAMVDHLATDHGCKKIAFMTGKMEMVDAQNRLNAYKRAMDSHGLPYDESYIFYGDYWRLKGPQAVSHFEQSHYGMPEAIVCSNDYMAISIIKELINRGYKVPEDVIVTGYDDLPEAKEVMPSLTTLKVPYDEMAAEAVNIIDRVFAGEEIGDIPTFSPVPVLRESCGCEKLDLFKCLQKRARAEDSKSDNAYMLRDMRFFTVSLENVSTFDEIADVIDQYLRILGNYKDYYVCLNVNPNRDMAKPYPSFKGYTNEMMCYLAVTDRIRTKECPVTYNKEVLIPAEYTNDEPQIFYFTPLHFLNKNYGYTAISYSDYYGLQGDYYSFSAYIGNALDAINDKIILQRTLEELESLYITDPLTNLYNRRGFEINAYSIYEDCIEKDIPVMVMGIDIDGLKYINDTYGHQAGDNAIQVFANALIYASAGKEVCARVGGDEFNVIAGNYTMKELDAFITKVFRYLKDYNESHHNEYNVEASFGAMVVKEHEGNSLEYYINQCDKKMYADKKKKKSDKAKKTG